jgi:CBS domain containing-hemolysin-like protein
MATELALVLLALVALLAFGLALGRSALVNSHAARLRALHEGGLRRAGWALRVAEDATRLILAAGLGQNLLRLAALGIALGAFGGSPLGTGPGWARWFGVLLLAGLALALIESLGDLAGHRDPERWAMRLVPVMGSLIAVLAPAAGLLRRLPTLGALPGVSGRPTLVTEEEIKTLVDAGEEGGAIEEEEKEMIFSIFQLGDTLAREVMVPRIDIIGFEAGMALTEAARTLIATGHSRAPVYAGTIDNVVGLLYAKDVLAAWQAGTQDKPVREVMRPVFFVPEAKKLDDLLQEMQANRVQMVVVVDEYGGTAGMVTLEDIVEEIVGEIQDEYDLAEEMPYQELSEGSFRFIGGIDLDDVNELTGARLSKEAGETLGGLIYSLSGRVPAAGDVLETGGLRLKVEQVTGRRIRKVLAVRLEPGSVMEAEDDHPSATT